MRKINEYLSPLTTSQVCIGATYLLLKNLDQGKLGIPVNKGVIRIKRRAGGGYLFKEKKYETQV